MDTHSQQIAALLLFQMRTVPTCPDGVQTSEALAATLFIVIVNQNLIALSWIVVGNNSKFHRK